MREPAVRLMGQDYSRAVSTGHPASSGPSCRPTDDLRSADAPHGFEELSGASERPMIIPMARLQQRAGEFVPPCKRYHDTSII